MPLLFLLNSLCSSAAALTVTAVLSEEGGVYQEFVAALQSNLAKQNIALDIRQAGSPIVANSDLVIAVGFKASVDVSATTSSSILHVYISKESFSKLQHDYPRHAGRASAIYLEQPIERQVSLLAAALPDVSEVGVLYSHAPPELRLLRTRLAEHGKALHELEVRDHTLPSALQEVLKNSEVILALPDGEVYNASTIRNILLASYRARVPIVGFSASFVRAGAVCAVYTTPFQLAGQAAAIVRQFNENRELPMPQYPSDFEVGVNEQVARSLGLSIPPAMTLYGEIGGRK